LIKVDSVLFTAIAVYLADSYRNQVSSFSVIEIYFNCKRYRISRVHVWKDTYVSIKRKLLQFVFHYLNENNKFVVNCVAQ